MNNVEWARKLMAGDVSARAEFQRLTELKVSAEAAEALAGPAPQVIETTIGGEGVRRGDLLSAAADLRQLWAGDTDNVEAVIGDVLNPDIQVDAAFLQEVQAFKASALKDREFTEALLAGEPEATKRMTLWNAIIAIGTNA
jgi:hypothetical protein